MIFNTNFSKDVIIIIKNCNPLFRLGPIDYKKHNFNTVKGFFDCSKNELKGLKGTPGYSNLKGLFIPK